MRRRLLLIILSFLIFKPVFCQSSNADDIERPTGIWNMFFYVKQFNDSQFGVQGDFQDRNWDLDGDFEQ